MIALFLLVFAAAAAGSTGPASRPAVQVSSFHKTVTRTLSLNYLVQLPPGYDDAAAHAKKYPLLIFLHGSGECGTDPKGMQEKLTLHGPMKALPGMPQFSFVVVAPQCPSELEWWQVDSLDALLDDVLRKYDVDPDRVYLTGLSMGGYAVWDWAVHRPERFAAVAPISGEPNTDLAEILAKARLPIWAFHGEKDREVWPHEDQKMVRLINQLGGDAKLTLYPDAGHDAWTRTYRNPALYEWLLAHDRQRTKQKD